MFIEILNFFKIYWFQIFEVAVLLFSIILCLIRKRPLKVVDTVKGFILDSLPVLIRVAEQVYGSGHGSEKLDYVFSLLDIALKEKEFEFTDYYKRYARLMIEQILATPQKKK